MGFGQIPSFSFLRLRMREQDVISLCFWVQPGVRGVKIPAMFDPTLFLVSLAARGGDLVCAWERSRCEIL